jgi:hypothetical protein
MSDPYGEAPLSLEDAANAYANVSTEAPQGQAEDEPEAEATADVEDTELADEVSEETDEGETEEQGQAEDESDDEPESDQGRFVAKNGKVKLDDGSVVTVAELVDGRLLRSDYTRKTMEHSEAVKAFEARSSAIAQQEQELQQRTEFVTSLLQQIVPPPPNPELADPRSPNYNPQQYMAQRAQHDYWAGHLGQVEAQQQQAMQAKQAEMQKSSAEKARAEWGKLVERIPDLKEQAKADQFAKDLIRVGQTYGFSEQELMAQLPGDHRFSLALRDASRWQRFQANKAKAQKKVEGKVPVLKGGQRLDPQRAKAKEGRAAMERLNQSGSLKDGVAALLAIEGKG